MRRAAGSYAGNPRRQRHGAYLLLRHYADVLVSAAASLGWVDRSLALRRPTAIGTGSTEHSSTEIWSNQYRKWVLLIRHLHVRERNAVR